jgi:hypothetical protein
LVDKNMRRKYILARVTGGQPRSSSSSSSSFKDYASWPVPVQDLSSETYESI